MPEMRALGERAAGMPHTPGPWKREGYGGAEIVGADGEGVCRLYKVDGRYYADGFDPTTSGGDVTEANCKIVEAAPELRDALVKLSNEVLGSLPLLEEQARRDMGNTNYTILIQRAQEARNLLNR